jgi:hypothetical protein
MDFFVLIGTFFMSLDQHQEMIDAFSVFDSEGTGYFSKDQIKSIMMSFGDCCRYDLLSLSLSLSLFLSLSRTYTYSLSLSLYNNTTHTNNNNNNNTTNNNNNNNTNNNNNNNNDLQRRGDEHDDQDGQEGRVRHDRLQGKI